MSRHISVKEVLQELGLPGLPLGNSLPLVIWLQLCVVDSLVFGNMLMGVMSAAGPSVQADGQEAHHS